MRFRLTFVLKLNYIFLVERPSTPGDANCVFCFVELEICDSEKLMTPYGTAFAISATHVLVAAHHFYDVIDKLPSLSLALIKSIPSDGDECEESELIGLKLTKLCQADDWAVFERTEGVFDHFAQICPESRLPKSSQIIGVKDYPVGLISTKSAERILVASISAKVYQY